MDELYLRIVREAAACTKRGEIEALLCREGIYASLLAAWRKQLALHGSEALVARKRGPKPKLDAKDCRIAELEKRVAKLEAKATSPARGGRVDFVCVRRGRLEVRGQGAWTGIATAMPGRPRFVRHRVVQHGG